ncbi:MAG TPA: sigma-70 family RNA polymerase sigma factor [Longimicrobiales bacterium]
MPCSAGRRWSDIALAEKVRAGETEALAELYARYWRLVRSIAYRLTESREDADDVLQDVFVALPDALRTFEGRGSLEGWLRTVAARRSLMALRKRRSLRETPLDAYRRHRTPSAAEPTVDRIALERALAELADPLRVVFILHEVHGFKHQEISEMLGIGVEGSKSRLHRAVRRLRERLRSGQ